MKRRKRRVSTIRQPVRIAGDRDGDSADSSIRWHDRPKDTERPRPDGPDRGRLAVSARNGGSWRTLPAGAVTRHACTKL